MSDATEEVVLVDAEDRPIGTAPKLSVHHSGILHRAFSILIHDGAGNLLLQKRHPAKYHSGGLWTNTCCGHPRPGEDVVAAAQRRLEEEMGFNCELSPLGTLIYRAEVGGGLVEHELVHLFAGVYRGAVHPDAQEAEDYAWRPLGEVQREAAAQPHRFTAWFRRYLDEPRHLETIEDAPKAK
jgi:isopentenyl-diphosphate delta-isomerase